MAPKTPHQIRETARYATNELRDAARDGRTILAHQRDPLVLAIHDAIDVSEEMHGLKSEFEAVRAELVNARHAIAVLTSERNQFQQAWEYGHRVLKEHMDAKWLLELEVQRLTKRRAWVRRIFTHDRTWFRVFGHGLWWTNGPPRFSERYGHQKPILRLGQWRVFRLGEDPTRRAGANKA